MRSSFARPFRAIARWYDKAAAFNVESFFSRKRQSVPKRTIFVNENLPADYLDKKGRVLKDYVYDTNQVITSKYTIITFVPRNLLEQFRRVANIFFLVIAILQFSQKFSTISPGLVILPLLIVLVITGAKDGYEDIKRHQADREVNHSTVRVMGGGNWVNPNAITPKSKTFVRGIVPKSAKRGHVKSKAIGEEHKDFNSADVEYDDSDPQDAQPHNDLHRRHGHGPQSNRPHWRKKRWEDVAVGDFVKIMDNEPIPADILICATSEEENVAYVETKSLDGETNLKSRHALPALAHIRTAADCAAPHNKLRIECDKPNTNLYKLTAAVRKGEESFPVDIQTVLLRGTVLRNTGWAIGIVLFTGEDTRIIMNSGNTPSKRSKVERQMNPQVFVNLAILAAMATACGIADSVNEHRYYPQALWLVRDNREGDNPSVNGLITFIFALITFQNIVPISLYISIEFVRTVQAAFIYYDTEMYCKRTQQPTIARSWNLSDDLGQIQYIFSDKTGTLTQNQMFFRKCTIGGRIYDGSVEGTMEKKIKELPPVYKEAETAADKIPATPSDRFFSHSRTDSGSTAVPQLSPELHAAASGSDPESKHFYDANLARDLAEAANTEPGSPEAAHARNLNAFLTILALCHTVLTSVNRETQEIEYKAQSPDEEALVQAAADMGYIFRGRDREVLTLQKVFSIDQYGQEVVEKYELLNILEFSSARKRMSVIVKQILDSDEKGKIFLLTKGADNVIFERLRKNGTPESEMLKQTTEKHLDRFASHGLRTLTLAYRYIEEEEYEAWNERYHEASVAFEDREDKTEEVASEIEQDLRLVGATAIEDKLQDGVPEAIADLKKAGIKVWVATGDKLETAIAIGHSTNLISGDSNLIVVRGGSEDMARPVWSQLVHAAQVFFPDRNIVDDSGQLVDDALYTPPTSAASNHRANSTAPYAHERVASGRSSIVGHGNGSRPGGFILVIDGSALSEAFSDEQHKTLLLRLATHCEGVICCRVSPLQKALVVNLVKNGLGAMTLAIGDGANDVSMIQAADVGVGIMGEEGLQAVNSADYAIAQFRFLKRLLLVHGHWSYARNGNMILNFFYKNIVCIGVLWWFQIYNGWSAGYVFEYTYLLFWNSFWTIAPVIGIGLFDKVVDARALMELPELYKHSRTGSYFGMKWFSYYMMDGIVQSVIIYFLVFYAYFTPSARNDGYAVGLYEFSTVMVFGSVFAANFYNGLNTSTWTAWVFFCVFIGDLLVWVYTAIYDAIKPASIRTPVYGNNHYLFQSAYYWLAFPLVVILAVAPRYIFKAYQMVYFPTDFDVIRAALKKNPKYDFSRHSSASAPSSESAAPRPHYTLSRTRSNSLASNNRPTDLRTASRTDMSTGDRSANRGFDFSMEENGVALRRLQSNLSERHASNRNVNFVQSEATPKKRTSVLAAGKSLLRKSSRKKPPHYESA